MSIAQSVAAVHTHTHTHTHTLCLQDNKNLKKLGLNFDARKLYIKYRSLKVDMGLRYRQAVF